MKYADRYCPHFHHTAELLGRRWTAVILRVLAEGPRRFSDIRGQVPGLSDRLLASRLTELEAEGVVLRCEREGNACYGLSDKGAQVVPVLEAVHTLATAWTDSDTPTEYPGRIRSEG